MASKLSILNNVKLLRCTSTCTKRNKSSQRQMKHNHRTDKNLQQQRMHQVTKPSQKMVKCEPGLILSRGQIERLWNNFAVNKEKDKLDLDDFVKKYPYVNVSLTTSVLSSLPQKDTICKNRKDDFQDFSTQDESKSNDTHLTEEAENNLYRMVQKVQSAKLNEEVLPQIQELLIAEFEAVIDLWLQVVFTAINHGDDETSMHAAQNVARILNKWEDVFRKDVLEYDNDETMFYLPPPSTRVYQKVIDMYSHVASSDNSMVNLADIKNESTKLLGVMLKQLMTNRMIRLQSDEDQGYEHIYANAKPLNNTYNQVIRMWINYNALECYPNGNLETCMESANRASSLLNEMELYYHDVITIPSKNKEEMELLKSISPQNITFNYVLSAYSLIASVFNSREAVLQAEKILDRMEKRIQAYSATFGEGINNASKPNLTSYKMVLKAWAYLKHPTALLNSEVLLVRMENNPDLSLDTESYYLVMEAWRQHEANKTGGNRSLGVFNLLNKLKLLYIESDQGNAGRNNNLRPNQQCYDAVIRTCASVTDEEDGGKKVARQVLDDVYKDIITKNDHNDEYDDSFDSSLFVTVMNAYDTLLPLGQERDQRIQDVYRDCYERGIVDDSISSVFNKLSSKS